MRRVRRPAPIAVLVLLVGGLTGFGPRDGWAKDELPRRKLSPEFQYVDEDDDAKAAERLEKLVPKYPDERRCRELLKHLRTKRSYPHRMADRQTLDHVCTDGKTRQFTWILPAKYSARKPTGLLVFLHGAIRQPAPGGGAGEAALFAPALKRLGLIVIGPSTYEGVEWGAPPCRDLLAHVLTFAKQYFNVDENRVYLAGDSDGGRGTYAAVETLATMLAAAVPVIGAPGGVTRYLNLRNVSLFAINGETDTIFDVARVREAVEGMKAAGIDLLYKEIAGKGHDPYFFLTYQDEVCDFLASHVRDPYPKVVHWQVDPARADHAGGYPGDTCRWIRITETGASTSRGTFDDGDARLAQGSLPRVQASRDGNRIDVQTRGVKRYTLLVSDEMLDLSRDVEVHTNGHLSFRGPVAPQAQVILEEARRAKDRALVVANRLEIDVDHEEGG